MKPSERAFSLVYETHYIFEIPKIQSKKRAVTEKRYICMMVMMMMLDDDASYGPLSRLVRRHIYVRKGSTQGRV